MRTRIFLLPAIGFLLLSGYLHTAHAADKLLLFTNQYPPYQMTADGSSFAHNKENVTGICTDVVNALMDKANIDYQIRLRIWNHGYKRVQRNTNHGIYCMVKTPEREPLFQWVGPITSMEWSLFAMPDSDISLDTLKQARDYRIGGAKNDVITEYLTSRGFNVSVIVDDMKNPVRLKSGAIDLWASDSATGPYLAADQTHISHLKKVLTFNATPMYIGMSLDVDRQTIERLNNTLKIMHQSGEVQRIRESYGL